MASRNRLFVGLKTHRLLPSTGARPDLLGQTNGERLPALRSLWLICGRHADRRDQTLIKVMRM
jgi:hypothetical protein